MSADALSGVPVNSIQRERTDLGDATVLAHGLRQGINLGDGTCKKTSRQIVAA